MPKTIILFLSIFVLLLTQSCDKEEIKDAAISSVQNKEIDFSKISVQNNILTFDNIDNYTAIIDHEDATFSATEALIDYAQKLSFDSYAKQTTKPMDFDSKFVESILNKDRIVKIGKWFIKINVQTQSVYALSDEFEEYYRVLLTDNPIHKHIYQFTTHQNVMDRLADESTLNSRGIFCNEPEPNIAIAIGVRRTAYTPTNSYPRTRYVFSGRTTYVRLGIYYSLKATLISELETLTFSGSTKAPSSNPLRIFSLRKYKPRCKTEHGWYAKVTAETDSDIIYRSYEGSRRLTKYWMRIGWEVAYPGSGGYINVASHLDGAPYQRKIKQGY